MTEVYKKFSPEKYEVHLMVDEEQDGLRLDQFCQDFLLSLSRQQVKAKIKKGEVKIQGRPFPHKASVKVYHREIVEIFTPKGELEDEYWNGQKLDLSQKPEVLFEDDELLVIAKPPYMATHPTGTHLFNCATVYFEQVYQSSIHSIHRLDRETSGVLLLGKTPKGSQTYSQYFEDNKISKIYFMIAHKNKDMPESFTASERLGEKENFVPRLFVHCFDEKSLDGKHAQTRFHKIAQNESYVLALARPITGRQHQIRSHAAHYGFPLLGDKIYNGDPSVFMRFKDKIATDADHKLMQISRHALHATALKTPYKGKSKIFKSPIPSDLQEWLNDNFKELTIEQIELKISALVKEIF